MWFEAISRLKINLKKSELIPIGDVPNMEEFVEVLDCKVDPTTYLGLPLGAPYKPFRKRFALWKSQHLSKDGR